MRLVQHVLVGSAFVGALCLGVACNKNGDSLVHDLQQQNAAEELTGSTAVTGAEIGAVSADQAADRIVAARCAREAQCQTTGADKRLTDPTVCKQRLGESVGMDLRPSDCPRGVDGAALDTCLKAIGGESCSNPADTMHRLATCRTRELCLKTSDGR